MYVAPGHRFVVSLIVGVEGAPDAKAAARAVLGMTTYEGRGSTVWSVHDRKTGQTVELPQSEFEEEGQDGA